MHPADIQASLKKAGVTQARVAQSLRVTDGAIHLVLRGATKSARIARRISEVTGIPVAQLWPGKYPLLEAEQKGAAWAVQAQQHARQQLTAATRGKPRKAA